MAEPRGDVAAPPAAVRVPGTGRLVSLDIFRGITIAGMLLVNNPGTWSAIHPPLRHAAWHGWTPTDLIFPFFLFIVGVAMVYSFGSHTAEGFDRGRLMRKSAVRALKLFGLGLFLHLFPNFLDWDTVRIPGVLQRIAIAFLAGAFILLYFRLKAQVAIAAALLLGYWMLQTLVPAPGVFPGLLEPGTDLGAAIDRAVLGTSHLWSQSKTWDPEGLLSTLPAIATVLTGAFVGVWLRSDRSALEKTVGLFVAGNVAVVVGLSWGAIFPINKPLWTSSYVLLTSGLACHFLALCYWLADVRGWRRWGTPFMWFGMNAIAAFFLSSLGARVMNLIPVGETTLKGWLFNSLYLPLASPVNASLLFALSYVAFWAGVMWLLYRRRIFFKV